MNRRSFLKNTTALGAISIFSPSALTNGKAANNSGPAQIAITMDLEMARNFPRWEDTHWDYEKGNLNQEAKAYAIEAARRVKEHGGVIHFFAVGQVFEQENVDWLKQLHEAGHKIGNHTYDHAYLLAGKPEEVQYRFQRAPWLTRGKAVPQIVRENVQLCSEAMKSRIGIAPAGFRTPGGFANGLNGRTDIQTMLLDLGFKWVSCKYPAHPYGKQGERATREVLDGIVAAQKTAQPFRYSSGLLDIPMSPISDIGAFRNARWPLEDFRTAIGMALDWVIENRAVFDFLCHPSVMYPSDPTFSVIDLICERVRSADARAQLVHLDAIADNFR